MNKFALSGVPCKKISERLSRYLLDKKVAPKLCIEVFTIIIDHMQDKPLYR